MRLTVEPVLDASGIKALRGQPVEEPIDPIEIPSPTQDAASWVYLPSGEPLAVVTKLDPLWRSALRRAVIETEMTSVARTGKGMGYNVSTSRTFGWQPKRVMAKRESCRASHMATEFPEQHQLIEELGQQLTLELAALLPEQYEHDRREVVNSGLKTEWMIAPGALFTSGVINKSFQLPYHYDSQNFHTWSAMPTIRKNMDGGRLHLPEFNLVFPCEDGEVTWFCGRERLHGVTPMTPRRSLKRNPGEPPYRYSVVFYALQGLKDCATHAVEEGEAAARRTVREQAIADKIRSQK